MKTDDQTTAAIGRLQRSGAAIGVVGIILTVLGALTDRHAFFQAYLFAYVVWVGLTLGCFAAMMFHYTVRGVWGLPIIRVLEAGARMLPLMALLLVPILAFGMQDLYPWARPEAAQDLTIVQKRGYLNVPFFAIRSMAYFAVWILLAQLLTRWSVEQDRTGDPALAQKRTNLSAPGLVIYVLTLTLASTDWVMSLYPHWYSTIFGLQFVVGQGLMALAFATAIVTLAAGSVPFTGIVIPKLTRDLGNMLLTFVILWGYVALSQFLLIWSANLPEEIAYYLARMRGGWWSVGLVVVFGQFFVPFLLLLSSRTKRVAGLLALVAGWILAMRVLDLYWVVVPGYHRVGFHWLDAAAFLGMGGLWLAVYAWQLKRYPLLPAFDPRLQETLRYA
jgi:hypothetical protein